MQTETTQTRKKSEIEVAVMAYNHLYEWAEKIYNHEREHFSQFIGKDIFKVDGNLKEKYKHDTLSHDERLQDGTFIKIYYHLYNKHGWFGAEINICISGGSYDVKPTTAFCQYHRLSVTLFDVKEGKLIDRVNDIEYLKTRYDLKELTQLADQIKEAAKKYDAIHDKMPYQFTGHFWLQRLTN